MLSCRPAHTVIEICCSEPITPTAHDVVTGAIPRRHRRSAADATSLRSFDADSKTARPCAGRAGGRIPPTTGSARSAIGCSQRTSESTAIASARTARMDASGDVSTATRPRPSPSPSSEETPASRATGTPSPRRRSAPPATRVLCSSRWTKPATWFAAHAPEPHPDTHAHVVATKSHGTAASAIAATQPTASMTSLPKEPRERARSSHPCKCGYSITLNPNRWRSGPSEAAPQPCSGRCCVRRSRSATLHSMIIQPSSLPTYSGTRLQTSASSSRAMKVESGSSDGSTPSSATGPTLSRDTSHRSADGKSPHAPASSSGKRGSRTGPTCGRD